MAATDEIPNPWPLWDLVLRTPRLELRPDDDAGLLELLAEACRGIHPPDRMPFGFPWTDAPPTDMVRNGMRFHWNQRAATTPTDWYLNFLVRRDGKVIGNQGLYAKDFHVLKEVSTGSWIGQRFQGEGIGTEMRAAVLMFAFDHLGAEIARSAAFTDSQQSNGVSRRLGYHPDGTFAEIRRGEKATLTRLTVTLTRLTVTRTNFNRPTWPLEVTGSQPALEFLEIN